MEILFFYIGCTLLAGASVVIAIVLVAIVSRNVGQYRFEATLFLILAGVALAVGGSLLWLVHQSRWITP